MLSMKEKIPTFLKNVKNGIYTPNQLNDISELSKTIAGHVNSTPEEAIAMLGFLLENGYVKIETSKGITLKDDDPKTSDIINTILSN